ncbi:TPA: DMT family transporter [Pseudomonas aeruginosa]
MSSAHLAQMFLLAALWGSSFVFLRLGIPEFGVGWLIELRALLAFLVLLPVTWLLAQKIEWRRNWPHFLLLGAISAALPFLLLAYAARTLPASVLAVLNSCAPIWAALFGWLFFGQKIQVKTVIGLLLGILGVAWLTLGELDHLPAGSYLAILAACLAPVCYAAASALAWRSQQSVGPLANTTGGMAAAAVLVLPFCSNLPAANPGGLAWASAFGLGVLCTGLAYVLYFRLTAQVGPTKALSVTFLIPLFGILWGALFLDEPVGANLLLGTGLIVLGTALSTGLPLPRGWFATGITRLSK